MKTIIIVRMKNFKILLFFGLLSGLFNACRLSEDTQPTKPSVAELMKQKLEDSLKTKEVGYAFAIYEGTELLAQGSGGFQSRAVDPEGQKNFTADTKLHIASMTKTLTAMAFLRVAQQYKLNTTDKIAPFLPTAWVRGAGVAQITFGDLLTHRSGITGLGSNCQNGAYTENVYSGLRRLVEKGVTTRGSYCYQNANFGLFRVLIPRILGYQFTGNETTDDAETQKRYLAFLQQEIFTKAGINATIVHPPGNPTYTYNFPIATTQRGWNPGDFSQTFGAYGVYLTATEAGKIYATALSSANNAVLPNTLSDSLLAKDLGVYKVAGQAGTAYYHDGWWYSGLSSSGQGLRTIWMKLPNNITCVLFVNALVWRNGSLVFPYNSGNIVAFTYNAYAQAMQARGMRLGTENETLQIEHPEPH
ncbi:MAG: serine hydrolase domain-containing protein [Spirosomataceae bacterium]